MILYFLLMENVIAVSGWDGFLLCDWMCHEEFFWMFCKDFWEGFFLNIWLKFCLESSENVSSRFFFKIRLKRSTRLKSFQMFMGKSWNWKSWQVKIRTSRNTHKPIHDKPKPWPTKTPTSQKPQAKILKS